MEALQGEAWLGVFPSVGVFFTVLGPLGTFPVIVSTSFSFSVVLEASLSERAYLLNFAQNLIIIYFFVCFLFPYNSLYILCSTYLFSSPQTLSFLFCIAVWPINNVVPSDEWLRDSAIYIHISILPQHFSVF